MAGVRLPDPQRVSMCSMTEGALFRTLCGLAEASDAVGTPVESLSDYTLLVELHHALHDI